MRFKFPYKSTLTISLSVSVLVATTDVLANSCAKADIDYYLQRGFTHNQIVRLCSTVAPNKQSQQPPLLTNTPASTESSNQAPPLATSLNRQPASTNEDKAYFQTVLNAKSTTLTPSSLSYVSRECVKYGEENLAGLKSKACANTKVTINFNGLRVVKAVKGIFLIRDQELILQGNIQREYLDINSMNPKKQAEVRAQLSVQPKQLDLPVLKGIDPKQVADKLKKYINLHK